MMIFKMLNSDSDFKANGEASQSNSSGKSLSEAFIFASNNPQYDKTLFIDLPVNYSKKETRMTSIFNFIIVFQNLNCL